MEEEYSHITGPYLLDLLQRKNIPKKPKPLKPFLIAEVVKTLGIINYAPAIPILKELLGYPKNYGDWDHFIPGVFYKYVQERIRSTATRALKKMGESVQKERKGD